MEFCQDAQFKLEAIPSSTVEYVESLTFLDDIQEKVSNKEDLIFIVTWVFIKENILQLFSNSLYDGPGNDRNHSLRPVPPKGEKRMTKAKTMRFSFVGSVVISSVQCYCSSRTYSL